MLFDRQVNPDVHLVYLNVYHLCLMGAVKAHSHARCLPHKTRWTHGQKASSGSRGSSGSNGSNAMFLFRALRSSAQYMSKLVQRRIRSQQRKAVRGSRDGGKSNKHPFSSGSGAGASETCVSEVRPQFVVWLGLHAHVAAIEHKPHCAQLRSALPHLHAEMRRHKYRGAASVLSGLARSEAMSVLPKMTY